MNKKICHIILTLILLYPGQFSTFSQNSDNLNQSYKWMRVQSDNGEFSVEVSENSNYFFDKDGFWGSEGQGNFGLKNMSLLNSYSGQTLLSVEIYETKKAAVEMFIRADKRLGYSPDSGQEQIKRMIKKTDEFYSVKQYYNSQKFVYILTAASKLGQTAAMKHFFDSLTFKPDTKDKPNPTVAFLSKLKVTPINVNFVKDKQTQSNNQVKPESLIIVDRGIPIYVESARRKEIQGTIKFRIEFSSNGFISTINVIKSLPEGLLRQAVFTALRLKFIPAEQNGIPITVTGPLEYKFAIY